MKNYFLLIVLAAYDLVLAGPVWAFNIDQFHANIAHKYGVQTSKLSVEPVIRPGYIDKLTRLGERTLQRLEKFANTLESNTEEFIDDMLGNTVLDLDGYLTLTGDDRGPKALFTAVNVQIKIKP